MKKLDHLRHLVSTSYCWWFSHPKADHLEMEIKPKWYGGKTETFPLTGLGPRISEPWTINSIMPGSPMIIIKRIPSYNKILQPSPVETLKNFSKYLRNPPENDHISHPGRDCWRRCSVSQGGYDIVPWKASYMENEHLEPKVMKVDGSFRCLVPTRSKNGDHSGPQVGL